MRTEFNFNSDFAGFGLGSFRQGTGPTLPSGMEFSLTAGSFMDAYFGYITTAAGVPSQVGSISNEPLESNVLIAMYDAGAEGIQISFQGDVVSILTGKTWSIDSTEMITSSPPTFNEGQGWTNLKIASETKHLVNGQTHAIQIS